MRPPMDKRVGIVTFLHNDNYGSTLQAWALQQTLRGMGFSAEHIDYDPSGREKIINLIRSGNSPRLILEGLRKRAVRAEQSGAREKSAAFTRFLHERMTLSPVCRDRSMLKAQAAREDLLLCGSDQIWSPIWLNPAYFLDFALPGQRKIAYAASLGVAALPSARKARRIAALLRGFDAISVREEEGAALLEKMAGVRPAVMPDPVFLPRREDWLSLAELPGRKHPYLLCYFIGDDPTYWQRAEEYARRSGLRIKVIPVAEGAYHQKWELCGGLTPPQWLGYLAEAAYVCTDSFHGAAFCAILQRPFSVFRRYREDDPESKNSRVDQLMRSLGLDKDGEDIPWEQVSARIGQLRQTGLAWLADALSKP